MNPKSHFLALLAFAAGLSLFVAAQERPASSDGTVRIAAPTRESQAGRLPNFWAAESHEALAKRIVAAMTDEELLAQIFMFGWSGNEPSKELVAWVEERSLGGVKVFGWGTDDAQKVALAVNLLQDAALSSGRFSIPLFVATDQEGGIIRHIKGAASETPGNMAIGAAGLESDAYFSGFYIASELAALGVNINFAPVADLYTSRDSAVTATRSFGDNPQAAARLSAAFATGTRAAGVLPTAKHFPGHGATSLDSHKSLPSVNASLQTLKERELVPFEALIAAGVPAIMSAHVSFPRVTGTDEPASFSSFILQNILREEMGFEGLVITDDIAMDGAAQYAGSLSRAAELAILAGSDIILCSKVAGFADALWTRNINNMKNSAAFREAVLAAATRLIELKLSYFKGGNSAPIFADIGKVGERVPAPKSAEFFAAQARRSVTPLYGEGLLPIKEKDAGKILIVAEGMRFIDAGLRRFPSADGALAGDGLFGLELGGYNAAIIEVSSRAGLSALNELSTLKGRPALIAVLTEKPALIELAKSADAAIAVYSSSPYSIKAAFEAIAGDFAMQGSLPFSVNPQGGAP